MSPRSAHAHGMQQLLQNSWFISGSTNNHGGPLHNQIDWDFLSKWVLCLTISTMRNKHDSLNTRFGSSWNCICRESIPLLCLMPISETLWCLVVTLTTQMSSRDNSVIFYNCWCKISCAAGYLKGTIKKLFKIKLKVVPQVYQATNKQTNKHFMVPYVP